MLHFLGQYGLFLAQAITIVLAIFAVVAGVLAVAGKGKLYDKIIIKNLNEVFDDMRDTLNDEILSKSELKAIGKQQKAQRKAEKKATKQTKKEKIQKKRVFVVDFDGDIRATQVNQLREVITAILTVATPKDEVLIRLESPGGLVHSYGLAASQLHRLKEKKIPLTIAVDKVAASGGYLMACVGDKILCAPFAIIGSIGVLIQIPNFNRLLKKHDIDYEQISAGEYKRTLSLFAENTDKGRAKMKKEIEETHELFKEYIREHRSQLDVDKIATGEHWLGTKAKELNLVDENTTSDNYLLDASDDEKDIFLVEYTRKRSLGEKMGMSVRDAVGSIIS